MAPTPDVVCHDRAMCGIAGIVSDRLSDLTIDRGALERMGRAIRHRGPDASGDWIDDVNGIGFTHRRLSIVDLSDAGAQPMTASSGRWVLTYNGEIYNAAEIRAQLPAGHFRGHCDTEVLVEALDTWGVEATLERLDGMYAFAAFDRATRRLVLARDPLGEKPLYYGLAGRDLVFGSELGSLMAHPSSTREIDQDGLAALLRYKFVPAPLTILDGVRKLLAGEMITVDLDDRCLAIQTQMHWDARSVARAGFESQVAMTLDDAVDDLEARLSDSVRRRSIADVPVGAFLSGGIDSSTVVALLAKQQDVHTFSIGFTHEDMDEAPFAASVAKHVGTRHTELYMSPQDLLGVVDDMPTVYSEPFADSSQLPTTVISRLAREHVKVVLSGDGGDELFGGYGRYGRTESAWPTVKSVPVPMRRHLARGLELFGTKFPTSRVPDLAALPPRIRGRALGVAAAGRARGLASADFEHFYHDVLSDWPDPSRVLVDAPAVAAQTWPLGLQAPTMREQMMLTDLLFYLPEDILVKVDRASMAAGLETRVPILERGLVEASFRYRSSLKFAPGQEKLVLRELAYRHIPRELLDRPKMGFGVPLDEWLRGPLRQWATDMLEPGRLRHEGLIRSDIVDRVWRAHLDGRGNWSRWLWNILMFQSWRSHWTS